MHVTYTERKTTVDGVDGGKQKEGWSAQVVGFFTN